MSTEQEASLVEVQIPHCSAADADSVFAVLRTAFPRSPGLGGEHRGGTGDEHRVWLGTVDARTHDDARREVSLGRPTEVDLSGSPEAVRRVRNALADFFDVTDQPRISGDQEVEVRLRLVQP